MGTIDMKYYAVGALALSALLASSPAHADPVGATLLIKYFSVNLADPDFPGPDATVTNGSSLGPNGLPVGTGNTDLNPGTSEVTWWSPALNSHVTSTRPEPGHERSHLVEPRPEFARYVDRHRLDHAALRQQYVCSEQHWH